VGRPADQAARGLISLRTDPDEAAQAAVLAVASGVVRVACDEPWRPPAAADLPALHLAAAALEAEARGGAMGEPLRLAVWLQAAAARGAAGDIDGARALVPPPAQVAEVGNLARLAPLIGALDPSRTAEVMRHVRGSGARVDLTGHLFATLAAYISRPTGDLAGQVRECFDLLVASGGAFAGELAIGVRAALTWRGLERG